MSSLSVNNSVEMALALACQVIESNKDSISISDLVSYQSTRPFNMKGQEFEEIVGHMLNETFSKINVADIRIENPKDKKSDDLILKYGRDEEYLFSVKNYTLKRFQISTFASSLENFEEEFINKLKLKSGDILEYFVAQRLLNDILQKIDVGIVFFALTNLSKKQPFADYDFSENDLIMLFKDTRMQKYLNGSINYSNHIERVEALNQLCEQYNFKNKTNLSDEEKFMENRNFIIKKFKEYTNKCSTKKDDHKASYDIYLKLLNKVSFLEIIDLKRVEVHQTEGKTSHFKFWFYIDQKFCDSSIYQRIKDTPLMSFDLGRNALNRGLWFYDGEIHFGCIEEKVLSKVFKDLLTLKNYDSRKWVQVTDSDRIQNFLNFLKTKK